MLDFRPKGARARNYLARREQRRLLTLVLAAGLVIVLIQEAARPRRWLWFVGGAPDVPAAGRQAAQPKRPAPERAANEAVAANVAGQAEAADADTPADRAADHEAKPPLTRPRPLLPGEFIAEAEAHDLPRGKKYFPGVEPELFRAVRDDTVFRSSDHVPFYHLLDLLNRTSEAELERAAIGEVSYAQVYTQPKEFRGDLVTMRGTVRRVTARPTSANHFGISQFYQTVLEPEDRSDPVVFYCLELPAGLLPGDRLNVPATITGFFYKRWSYFRQDKEITTWPLLLAKTVHLLAPPAPAMAARPAANPRLQALAAVAAAVFSVFVVSLAWRMTRRPVSRFQVGGPHGSELATLPDTALAPDVRQQLAELARQGPP
jgi:hypothetical protein